MYRTVRPALEYTGPRPTYRQMGGSIGAPAPLRQSVQANQEQGGDSGLSGILENAGLIKSLFGGGGGAETGMSMASEAELASIGQAAAETEAGMSLGEPAFTGAAESGMTMATEAELASIGAESGSTALGGESAVAAGGEAGYSVGGTAWPLAIIAAAIANESYARDRDYRDDDDSQYILDLASTAVGNQDLEQRWLPQLGMEEGSGWNDFFSTISNPVGKIHEWLDF